MKFKQGWLWIWMAACVSGTAVAADDAEAEVPAAAPEISVLLAAPPAVPQAPTQVTVGGSGRITVVSDPQRTQELVVEELVSDLNDLAKQTAAAAEPPGKYWIGLMCAVPTDALRSQLDLAADTGMLVEEVSDGSPARKAGIQQYDVLLTATNGTEPARPLSSLQDLVSVVQASEGKTLKIDLLRHGKKQSLNVSPEERPAQPAAAAQDHVYLVSPKVGLRWAGPLFLNVAPQLPPGTTVEFKPAEGPLTNILVKRDDKVWESDVKSIDKLPPEIAALVQQQLAARHAGHPAAFAYHQVNPAGNMMLRGMKLPPNVTITVVRSGADPAKIKIQKDDKVWEGTESDLSNVPPDMRPLVSMSLGGPGMGPVPFTRAMTVMSTEAHPDPDGPKRSVRVRAMTNAPQNLEQKVQDLADKVEKLQQALEKSQAPR